MSEDNKNELPQQLNLAPQQVTKPVIQALFNNELVRKNYRKILQGLQNLNFTKDNLQSDYPALKEADKFVKELDKYRLSVAGQYQKVQDDLLSVFRELIAPISAEIASKKAALKTANEANLAEKAAIQKENNRILGIQNAITNFINNTTRDIANAPDDTALVNIQKRIGSEKARSTFYMEFLDDLKSRCDELTPLINQRKDTIKEGQRLLREQQEAIQSGDVEKATEIKESLEVLDMHMEESMMRIQQKAFEQATKEYETVVAEPMIETVKARTSRWKWRVDDIVMLHKKNPELTQVVPNTDAIDALLDEKRKQFGKDDTEVKFGAITFYKEKYY
jgi:hypothetical protein